MSTNEMSRARFTFFDLAPSERPKRFYSYYVTGRPPFPYDMLRYDSAWPARGEDAAILERMDSRYGYQHQYSVLLHSYSEPTIERWNSFTWSVGTKDLSG